MSDFSEFAGQIVGLLVITLGAGMVWLILTVVIFQRAAERRRRKRDGREPLPSFFTQAYNWSKQQLDPTEAPTLPTPDIEMLTTDLPSPDLDDLTREISPPQAEEFALSLPEDEEELVPESPSPRSMAAAIPPVQASTAVEIALHPAEEPEAEMALREPDAIELPEDAVEILRLYRDLGDGTIIIEMRDHLFRSFEGVKGTKYEKRFTNLLNELILLGEHAGMKIARKSPVTPTPSPQRSQPEVKIETRGEPEEPSVRGIAGQIESFLQHRLAAHPNFRGRQIHVHPSPDGGVQIEVEGRFFDSVDDVDSADIRYFLQETIADWSESNL